MTDSSPDASPSAPATSSDKSLTTDDVTVRVTRWRFWYFIFGYPSWKRRTWTATSRGVVAKHGVFSRNETRVPWARITDKSIQQSLLGRIFNHGTVTLETAGEASGILKMANVGNVEHFYSVICERSDIAAGFDT